MKALKSLLLTGIFGLIITACGSDEPAKISPEKAKAAFSSANQTLATELGNMKTAPGFTGMQNLSDLTGTSNPFNGRIKVTKDPKTVTQYVGNATKSFRQILVSATSNARLAGDEPFNYNDHKGVYTWNGESWNFETSNIIKIIFPTEGSTTNNAEFQLTAYEEVATPNGNENYSPTIINAILKINNTVEAEIDLNAEYGGQFDEPVFADIQFFVNPFTLQLDLDDKKATSTSFAVALSKSGTSLLSAGANVNFYDTDKYESNIKNASVYFQLVNVRFILKADASKMNTANDINDVIDITIKVDGAIAGKVVFEQNDLGDIIAYVRYTDGSKELLDDVFEDLFLELDGILS